jgi:transposase
MSPAQYDTQEDRSMEALYDRVCGLDVHKKFVMACVRCRGEGGRIFSEVRRFETETVHLRALQAWLEELGVTQVAMESTGVFWKPVYNVLEGGGRTVLVVNAQHVKNVPGRKTDVSDAQWLAHLLQCGLLKASFVPNRPLRELRDLNRSRTKLTQQRAAVVNRLHKVLEDANIKLASVATDIVGVSGRWILGALIAGTQTPAQMAELAVGRLREKIPQLRVALEGHVTEHHRFQLRMLLEQLGSLDRQIEQYSQRIATRAPADYRQAVELAQSAAGVGQSGAQAIIAEIGTAPEQFPSANHLASWGGQCPGNHRSAGKTPSGAQRSGNRWLKAALALAAQAASRKKGSYFQALYQRVARRRGRARALGAVAHALLVALYHMLKRNVPFHDLGDDYFERRSAARLTQYHLDKLQRLGHHVTLERRGDAEAQRARGRRTQPARRVSRCAVAPLRSVPG